MIIGLLRVLGTAGRPSRFRKKLAKRFVSRPQEQPPKPPYIPMDFEKIYRFFFVKSDNVQEASDIGPPKLELTLPPSPSNHQALFGLSFHAVRY